MKKRAQEEITGFVLIMVIVAILFLVFLAFSVRRAPQETKESKDVYSFLESSMEYSTSCATSFEPAYSTISELIKDCYSNSVCISGKTACQVLNSTLTELLDASWKTGKDRPIKAYIFNSSIVSNSTRETIISIKKGDCSATVQGAEYLSSALSKTIVSTLKLCY